jgi:hypothetical protein
MIFMLFIRYHFCNFSCNLSWLKHLVFILSIVFWIKICCILVSTSPGQIVITLIFILPSVATSHAALSVNPIPLSKTSSFGIDTSVVLDRMLQKWKDGISSSFERVGRIEINNNNGQVYRGKLQVWISYYFT